MAENKNELIVSLTSALCTTLDNVATSLPTDFNRDRFVQNAIAVINNNPDLLKYNRAELLTCMTKASFLGLDFMNQEAWLVPYGSHVQFQMGYKGACKFVKKYSIRPLRDVYAKAVRKGDDIKYGVTPDGMPYIEWNPVPFNGAEIVGVFAVAYFADGGILYEVMSTDEVNKIRRISKCGGSGPWKEHWEQMALKTVLKRLAKNIETDFDNVEQRAAWDSDNDEYQRPESSEAIDPFADDGDEGDVIDGTATEIPTDIPDVEVFK